MIIQLSAKALNGSILKPRIDLSVVSLSFGSSKEQPRLPMSTRALAQTIAGLTDILHELYPSLQLENPRLVIVSKDLERLRTLQIVPSHDSLAQGLIVAIISYIATEMGYKSEMGDKRDFMQAREKEFSALFLSSTPAEATHPLLLRVNALFKDKKFPEASKLLSSMDEQISTSADRRDWDLLDFMIKLKTTVFSPEEHEALFRNSLNAVTEHPEIAKQYYFEYIRFLENARDFSRPQLLLAEFENKYPLSILDAADKITYYHLRGRAEYARGDYLRGLDMFNTALDALDPADLESLARIFNSAVNCFNDNLFFDEALWIADKAKSIRDLLNLPESLETLSCIAGIRTKQGHHEQALTILQEVETKANPSMLIPAEHNRLYNYLAKSSVFCKRYDEAYQYLAKAETTGDPKGFSKQIRLFGLFQQKNYQGMERLFQESFMLPENHKLNDGLDRFVLGWAYTLMGEAALIQSKYRDAMLYLNDAIGFFLSDKYVLEAEFCSLQAWTYSMPEQYLKPFREMCDDHGLKQLFDEYVKKHSRLREDYYVKFNPEAGNAQESPRLLRIYEALDSFDDFNYIPEELHSVLISINLM